MVVRSGARWLGKGGEVVRGENDLRRARLLFGRNACLHVGFVLLNFARCTGIDKLKMLQLAQDIYRLCICT